jgi:hypothetical protein
VSAKLDKFRYPRGNLVDALARFMGFKNVYQFDIILDRSANANRMKKRIEKYVQDLRVVLNYYREGERKVKVMHKLIWQSASEYEFDGDSGPTTVEVRNIIAYSRLTLTLYTRNTLVVTGDLDIQSYPF